MTVSMFFLRNHGMSVNVASGLSKNNIELLDLFLKNNPKLIKNYSASKINKFLKFLSAALIDISKTDIFDNIYLLEATGVNLGSSKILEQTKLISEFSLLLPTTDWVSLGLNSASKKLESQINQYLLFIKNEEYENELSRWKIFYFFLKNKYVNTIDSQFVKLNNQVIQDLVKEGYLRFDKDRNYIYLAIDNLSFEEKIRDIFAINDYFYDNFIKDEFRNPPRLLEYLDQDFPRRDILMHRLEGLTLQEIGDKYSLSKERVRQLIKVVIKKMPDFLETEKYRSVFEKYDIEKTDFINIFQEDEKVYEWLNINFKKGDGNFVEYILQGDFSEEQKAYFLKDNKLFVKNGQVQKLTNQSVLTDILKEHADFQQYLSEEDIYYLYKEAVKKYSHLNIRNAKSLSNNLNRYPNIIQSTRKGFRYYQYEVDDTLKSKLYNLVKGLPAGMYSMNLIFKNNKEFLNEWDILDGYELHNLFKKHDIGLDKIQLRRNPYFAIGEIEQREFVFSILQDYNGEPVEKFLEYMSENYGNLPETLSAYISANFPENLVRGKILIKQGTYSKEILLLKKHLTLDIYGKDEFVKVVTEVLDKEGTPLTDHFIYELGYKKMGNLVVKKHYRSASDAIQSYIFSHTILRLGMESFEKTSEFRQSIYRMEKDLKVIRLSKDAFMSTAYLKSRGYDLDRIKEFRNSIRKYTKKGEYFTLFSLQQSGFDHEIFEDGFEDITLDRLIGTMDNMWSILQSIPGLFYNGEENKNINDFLLDELCNYESINVYDFTELVNKKYGTKFEEYEVKLRLKEVGVYYSEELNKVYIDKDDYFKEVYGN